MAGTYYVDPAHGNDSNDGLTTGTAFATLQPALAIVAANPVGPYTIQVAAGTITIPLAGYAVAGNNVTINGVVGSTHLVSSPSSTAHYQFKQGGDSYTQAGNYYTGLTLNGLSFDFTANTANQTSGLLLGAASGFEIVNCSFLGGVYTLDFGKDYLPTGSGVVHYCTITAESTTPLNADPTCMAPTNVVGVLFANNTYNISVSSNKTCTLFDAEPNNSTDQLNFTFSDNVVNGNAMGGAAYVQHASVSDTRRDHDILIENNEIHDCDGFGITAAGVTIRNNWFDFTLPSPSGNVPASAVRVNQNADGTVVTDNAISNMSGHSGFPAVQLDDVSNCVVARNAVVDNHSPVWTTASVVVRQTNVAIGSGFTVTVSGMTVTVASGQIQPVPPAAAIPVGQQTATLAVGANYDRIDLIAIDNALGTVIVKQGSNPPVGLSPAPPGYTTAQHLIPVAAITVPASATSLLQGNVFDLRWMIPANNDVSRQDPVNTDYAIQAIDSLTTGDPGSVVETLGISSRN